MRYLIVLLIIVISVAFATGCGKAPTGETNYKEIKGSIERGENPPPDVPKPDEREKGEGSSNVGGL